MVLLDAFDDRFHVADFHAKKRLAGAMPQECFFGLFTAHLLKGLHNVFGGHVVSGEW